MKVFISWNGEQSRQIALALHDWLPQALHAVKPYMSERDNEAGGLWEQVLAAELEATDFGIVCLTPKNLESRWINFEAGALSKAVTEARVVPLLFQLKNADVGQPLSRFMMKAADRQGILDTLKTINANAEPDRRLPDDHLYGTFEGMWPKLESKFHTIEQMNEDQQADKRTDRELLEEILLLLRDNLRRVERGPWSSPVSATTLKSGSSLQV